MGSTNGTTTLTVSSMVSGTITPYQQLTDVAGNVYATIVSQIDTLPSGSTGGVGHYTLSTSVSSLSQEFVSGALGPYAIVATAMTGPLTIEDNVFLHVIGKAVSVGMTNYPTTFLGNYYDGIAYYTSAHGEFTIVAPSGTTTAVHEEGYNVARTDPTAFSSKISSLFYSSSVPTDVNSYATLSVHHNTMVCNKTATGGIACGDGNFAQARDIVTTVSFANNQVDPFGNGNYGCMTYSGWIASGGSLNYSGNLNMLTGSSASKTATITGGTYTSTTITPTFASLPGSIPTSDQLFITGASNAGWNGQYPGTALASTPTSLKFPNTTNGASTGGSIADGSTCGW